MLKNKKNLICIFSILLVISMIFVTFSATMYENDARQDFGIEKEYSNYDKTNIGPTVEETIKKPVAETTIDPNTLYTVDSKKKDTINVIPLETISETLVQGTKVYGEGTSFTYISHRIGVTKVTGNYEFVEDTDDYSKTKLLLYNNGTDDTPGLSYAKSGFYQIGDDTYCFDKNGDMIKGIAKDDYDIIYNFGNDGKLISKTTQ